MVIYTCTPIMLLSPSCTMGEDFYWICQGLAVRTCMCACSGANSTAKNVDGKTAKDVAELNNQTDVVDRFQSGKASS